MITRRDGEKKWLTKQQHYIPNKYMLDDANNFSSFSSFSCYAKESVRREEKKHQSLRNIKKQQS